MPGVQSGAVYSLDCAVALAGQVQTPGYAIIETVVAASAIRAGAAVELTSTGLLQETQSGQSLATFYGVAKYRASKEPGTYAAGDQVPVVRKGRVYAIFAGGSKSELGAVNIKCSTDGSSARGTFTMTATATTTNAEITAAPAGTKLRLENTGSTALCLIELNLP